MPAHATIYKWIDDRGVTHYSQSPPPGRETRATRLAPTWHAPPAASAADDSNAGNRQHPSAGRGARDRLFDVRLLRGARDRGMVAERVHTCVRAQWNLRALEEPPPRYGAGSRFERTRTQPGNRDAERLRLLHIMDQSCDPRWLGRQG